MGNILLIRQIKGRKDLFLALGLYLLFAFVLFSNYKYIINSDGISYISIARNYLNGHLFYAINGYWSPLYSWLLIPFMSFLPGNLGNIVATKIFAIFIGLFTMVAIYLVIDNLNFNNFSKSIFLLTIIPYLLLFTFNFITPDLLVVCILLFYLNFLMDKKYRKNKYMGFLIGFLASIAFLSKSYFFFFFLIHFILSNLFYIKKYSQDRSVIKKNLLLGLSVFLVISSVWAVIISEKYDTITIGTSGSYNYALIGPESNNHAMFYQGLITPPNEFSVSSWEDPSYFEIKKWSPLESTQNFVHQFKIILNNIYDIILFSSYLLFIPILAVFLALSILFKSYDKSIKHNIIFILGTMILYAGGYILILVEERYLWVVLILSLILGFYSLNVLYHKKHIKTNIFRTATILIMMSTIFFPIYYLSSDFGVYKNIYDISLDLKSHGIKGNLASNDQWEIMDYYGYYLDSKYYGMTKKMSDAELKENLISNKIDYYFIWGDSSSNLDLGEIVYQSRGFRVLRLSKS